MKAIIACALLLIVFAESHGQLVRRKDYDAAFALQAGVETGMLTTLRHPELFVRPIAGLKMTFPFTRKWFLGGEVNYSELKYNTTDRTGYTGEWAGQDFTFRGEQKMKFDLKQVQLPLYLKYMLNCNKASVLFGFYGAYIFDARLEAIFSGSSAAGEDALQTPVETRLPEALDNWHAGVTVGYEHRIVKHLDIICRINIGMKEVVRNQPFFRDKLLPVQACITLSYDIFRIGDCGCD